MIIGVTGRVGSGKSRAANLAARKFLVELIDLDPVGHELLEHPQVKKMIIKKISRSIVNEDGTINRAALGEIVFSDSEQLRKLDRIMHIRMNAEVLRRINKNSTRNFIIVGALLREIGLLKVCHHVVVIDARDEAIRKAVGDKKSKILASQRGREEYQQDGHTIIKNVFNRAFDEKCLTVFSTLLA